MKKLYRFAGVFLIFCGAINIGCWAVWNEAHMPVMGVICVIVGGMIYGLTEID